LPKRFRTGSAAAAPARACWASLPGVTTVFDQAAAWQLGNGAATPVSAPALCQAVCAGSAQVHPAEVHPPARGKPVHRIIVGEQHRLSFGMPRDASPKVAQQFGITLLDRSSPLPVHRKVLLVKAVHRDAVLRDKPTARSESEVAPPPVVRRPTRGNAALFAVQQRQRNVPRRQSSAPSSASGTHGGRAGTLGSWPSGRGGKAGCVLLARAPARQAAGHFSGEHPARLQVRCFGVVLCVHSTDLATSKPRKPGIRRQWRDSTLPRTQLPPFPTCVRCTQWLAPGIRDMLRSCIWAWVNCWSC